MVDGSGRWDGGGSNEASDSSVAIVTARAKIKRGEMMWRSVVTLALEGREKRGGGGEGEREKEPEGGGAGTRTEGDVDRIEQEGGASKRENEKEERARGQVRKAGERKGENKERKGQEEEFSAPQPWRRYSHGPPKKNL
jgi:hypothetical protein